MSWASQGVPPRIIRRRRCGGRARRQREQAVELVGAARGGERDQLFPVGRLGQRALDRRSLRRAQADREDGAGARAGEDAEGGPDQGQHGGNTGDDETEPRQHGLRVGCGGRLQRRITLIRLHLNA